MRAYSNLIDENTEKENRFVNDGQKPDYKITWFDSSLLKIRECMIFSYGKDEDNVVAIFKFLYPGNHSYNLKRIECD